MTDPTNMSHQPTPLSPGGQVVGYNTLDGAVHGGCAFGAGDRLADTAADGGCVSDID